MEIKHLPSIVMNRSPHSHIVVRGMLTMDALSPVTTSPMGLPRRLRELLTLELGPQTEIELQDPRPAELRIANRAEWSGGDVVEL